MPNHTIQIRPADSVPREDLLNALNDAYADYFVPIHLSAEAFDAMIRRESVRLPASRVAVSGDQVVGMGLLAARGQRGWVGGMGVIPAYRRQGIGRQLMHALIAAAESLGLAQLQLEVITQNTGALQLYQTLGFETVRRLLVLNRKADTPAPVGRGAGGLRFGPIRPAAVLNALANLPAPERPWQRQHAATGEIPAGAAAAAYEPGKTAPAAVCLHRGSNAHRELLDIAAQSPAIGAALLHHVLASHAEAAFSYLNVAENDPLLPALQEAGFSEMIDQYEMIRNLNGDPSS